MRFTSSGAQTAAAFTAALLAWGACVAMIVAPLREDPNQWVLFTPQGGYAIAFSPVVLVFATAGAFLAMYATPPAKLGLALNLAAFVSVFAYWTFLWWVP